MTHTKLLDKTLSDIRHKWGHKAVLLAKQLNSTGAPLPTQIDVFDDLLGGGLLQGRLTEFQGIPTSGMTTLAFLTIANIQRQGHEVVFLDMAQTMDAAYAADCGVDLTRLLIVHPPDDTHALELLREIAATGVIGLIVLDITGVGGTLPGAGLQRRLGKSPTIPLILTTRRTMTAAISVQITCKGWLQRRRDVVGCQVRAVVHKHPTIPAGKTAHFPLAFGRESRR